MGNGNSKVVKIFLLIQNERDFKTKEEKEIYLQMLLTLDNDDIFKNDGNFYAIKNIIDDEANISVLFKFVMNTLRKLIHNETGEIFVQECKICVKIFRNIFPIIQYNYKKLNFFSLLWKEDNIPCFILQNYKCKNILILHIFNFLLILLFTENICINKKENVNEKINEKYIDNNNNNITYIRPLVKNYVDIYKLWSSKMIYSCLYNKYCVNNNNNEIVNRCFKNIMKNEKYRHSLFQKEYNDDITNKDKIIKTFYSSDYYHKNKIYHNSNVEKYEFINDVKRVSYNCNDKNHFNNINNGHLNNVNKDTAPSSSLPLYPQINSNNNNNDIINLEYIKNRTDILKCLLILLSSYMYYNNENFLKEKNFPLFLFTSGEVYFSANFFLSLLTIIYENEFNYFNFYFYNDTYLEFYNLCIHILNILIDFVPLVLKKNKKKRVHYMNGALKYFHKCKETINDDEKKNDEKKNDDKIND
ncbi:hypothetical protein PFTANZ_05290, partial [Plasmodium falciparum Tanzania (2000708)]